MTTFRYPRQTGGFTPPVGPRPLIEPAQTLPCDDDCDHGPGIVHVEACHLSNCAEPAMARVRFVTADGTEFSSALPYCRYHGSRPGWFRTVGG